MKKLSFYNYVNIVVPSLFHFQAKASFQMLKQFAAMLLKCIILFVEIIGSENHVPETLVFHFQLIPVKRNFTDSVTVMHLYKIILKYLQPLHFTLFVTLLGNCFLFTLQRCDTAGHLYLQNYFRLL